MELPDINVLIYAHREDAPEHDRYAAWPRRLAGHDLDVPASVEA